jgi:hypothetical protein
LLRKGDLEPHEVVEAVAWQGDCETSVALATMPMAELRAAVRARVDTT